MRLAVLTISTLGARGERTDSSGDAIVEWATARGYSIADRRIVSDDVNAIVGQLTLWCDDAAADLVLTTGGTGLSPTDVTPEAMQSVVERDAPGLAEYLRARAAPAFPRAVLSRGRAGVRNTTLIVNLPGSLGGVRDGLKALEDIVEHAVAVLAGKVSSHD
jgi:molybdopterin adenylyltransferase